MLEESPAPPRQGLGAAVRGHPLLSAAFVAAIALGMLAGALYLPAEWVLARRLGAGFVSGAGIWLLVVFTRFFYD
jgi:hypothetical protein